MDSVDSLTPASETEITFSISSDNDSESTGSGSASLVGKPSLGSLRATANGAIGSEMKERSRERERGRGDGEGGFEVGGFGREEGVVVRGEGGKAERGMPLMVLRDAEKRKSLRF